MADTVRPMEERFVKRGFEALDRSQQGTFPRDIEIHGRTFSVFKNVFSPIYMSSADFSEGFPPLAGLDFLDMGCGLGLFSILAALGGARRVVGTDINEDAVANTRVNVERYGVADRVEARCGDLFAAIRKDEQFDVIFWNSPMMMTPDDTSPTVLQRSAFDPAYTTLRRYIEEARPHLTPSGRLFIGFSITLGDLDRLKAIAAESGRSLVITKEWPATVAVPATFELIEVL
ncbi:MAG: methyltransferase small [Labilithrix sp.]|nr:methyltransferase small [Labilithrix sp.]